MDEYIIVMREEYSRPCNDFVFEIEFANTKQEAITKVSDRYKIEGFLLTACKI